MLDRVSRAQPPSPLATLAASAAPATCIRSAPRMPIVNPRRKWGASSSNTRERGASFAVNCSPRNGRSRRRARLGRDRRNSEGNLRHARLLQEVEHVNDALVLNGAICLDDRAKLGVTRARFLGEGKERVVVRQLLLIDGD